MNRVSPVLCSRPCTRWVNSFLNKELDIDVVEQIGTALGVTVSTIVFNRVVAQDSLNMGIVVDNANSNAPREALLNGYKAAEWTAFAFGAIGSSFICFHHKRRIKFSL